MHMRAARLQVGMQPTLEAGKHTIVREVSGVEAVGARVLRRVRFGLNLRVDAAGRPKLLRLCQGVGSSDVSESRRGVVGSRGRWEGALQERVINI